MKAVGKILLASIAAVVVIGGVSVLIGVVPLPFRHEQAHPPCAQLPNKKQVAHAIETHQQFVNDIQKVGQGIKVEVSTPCQDQPKKAVVVVRYSTDDERQAIDNVFQKNDGFGVPAVLSKK